MGLRFYQALVIKDDGFRGVVEAAMMLGAYNVLMEDVDWPNHTQRRSVAVTLFQGIPSEVERYRRLFLWRSVFDPTIQSQVFDASTGTVTAQNVQDDDIDRVIAEFWDEASLATDQDIGTDGGEELVPTSLLIDGDSMTLDSFTVDGLSDTESDAIANDGSQHLVGDLDCVEDESADVGGEFGVEDLAGDDPVPEPD